jgi:4-amino-4-deoxy-L-arabinose transferase-like glycosyltransferase
VAAITLADGYEPLADAFDYVRHASSIAAGEGYPDSAVAGSGPSAFRPPGYPYLLGAVFALAGESQYAGLIANALLGTAAVALVYLIALRLFEAPTALAAGAICALFPPLVFQATALMSEALFVVLVLAAVLCALQAQVASRIWPWAALLGVLCGAAALTRSNNGLLLLLPAVLAIGTAGGRTTRARLGASAVVIVAAMLTVLPWTVRSSLAFDHPVLLSTQAGYGVAGVYNAEARSDETFPARWLSHLDGPFASLFRRPDLDEVELDRRLREAALEYVSENPSYVFEVSLYSVLRLADTIPSQRQVSVRSGGSGVGERAEQVARYATWLVLAAALAGLVILVRTGRLPRSQWFVWLVPVVLVAPAVPVVGGPRYRAPADPFLAILAAVAVIALIELARRRGQGSRAQHAH